MTLEAIQAKLNFANDDRDRLNRELHDQSENQTRLEVSQISQLNRYNGSFIFLLIQILGRVKWRHSGTL
jgi:hypothetical protein